MDRPALERRWRALIGADLPSVAAARGWPIRADHCFARVLLDCACGGVWYNHVTGRPAYAHAADAILSRAVSLGEDALAGSGDLGAMNRQSLEWRSRGQRRSAGGSASGMS